MNDNPLFPNNEASAEETALHSLVGDQTFPPVTEEPALGMESPVADPTPLRESVPVEHPETPAAESAPPAEPAPTREPEHPETPATESAPIQPEAPRIEPNREPYYGGQPYSVGQPPYGVPNYGRPPYEQQQRGPAAGQSYYGRPTASYYGGAPYGAQGQMPSQGGYGYPPRQVYGQNGQPYGAYGTMPPNQPPRNPKPAPKKKKPSVWLLILLIVGCILIGTVSGILIGSFMDPSEDEPNRDERPTVNHSAESNTNDRPTRETQPLATSSGEEMTLNQIYNTNVPAIVGITNEYTQNILGQTSTAVSAGSGFIITSDGEILTNYHVVEGAEQLTVTLYDGREYPATLVGYEAESDVALIKIEEEDLPVCAIGDSDQVYVGEQIAAIGNPMGELTYTMTVGYVSAVDRFVNTDGTPISMIQVDAAINPGNSGGPVFNLYGEVIGIATAKYSGTLSDGATLEGLGFAIPINDIVEILNDLRVNGKVPDRAYMGVMVSMLPLDEEVHGIDHGVFVQSVEEDGSAFKAGVRDNDIILRIGDVELNAYENLQQVLRKYRAGDETTITVYRDGETITMPIVFDAKPETTEVPTTPVPTEQPTETETTEDPWEDFPWDEFPWGEFPWGDFGG